MNSNEKKILQQVKKLQETGNYRDAVDTMQRLLKTLPSSPALWTYFGGILSELKSWEEAESAFAMAITLDSKHINAYLGRGSMLSSKGMHAEAKACFLKVIEIDPGNQLAIDSLSDLENYGHLT